MAGTGVKNITASNTETVVPASPDMGEADAIPGQPAGDQTGLDDPNQIHNIPIEGIANREGYYLNPVSTADADKKTAAAPQLQSQTTRTRNEFDQADAADMAGIRNANDQLAQIADNRLNVQAKNYGIMSEFSKDFANLLEERGEETRMKVQQWFDDARKEKEGIQKAIDDAAANRINPGQFFANVGTAGTYSVALGVAVGHAASVMGGGPNTALDIMKSAIARNVQAQRDNMTNAWKNVDSRQTYFDSLRAAGVQEANAENLLYAQMYKNAEYRLEAMKQQTNSELARASISETQHMLNKEYLQYKIKMDTANSTQVQSQYYTYVQTDAELAQKKAQQAQQQAQAEQQQLEKQARYPTLENAAEFHLGQAPAAMQGQTPAPGQAPAMLARPGQAEAALAASPLADQPEDPRALGLDRYRQADREGKQARQELSQQVQALPPGKLGRIDAGVVPGANAAENAEQIAKNILASGEQFTPEMYQAIQKEYGFMNAAGDPVPYEFFSNDPDQRKWETFKTLEPGSNDLGASGSIKFRWKDQAFDEKDGLNYEKRLNRRNTIQTFVEGVGLAQRISRLSQQLGASGAVGNNVMKQISESIPMLLSSDSSQKARNKILALNMDEDTRDMVQTLLTDVENLGKVERTNPKDGNVEALQSGKESEAQKKTGGGLPSYIKNVGALVGFDQAAIRGAAKSSIRRYNEKIKQTGAGMMYFPDDFNPASQKQGN